MYSESKDRARAVRAKRSVVSPRQKLSHARLTSSYACCEGGWLSPAARPTLRVSAAVATVATVRRARVGSALAGSPIGALTGSRTRLRLWDATSVICTSNRRLSPAR